MLESHPNALAEERRLLIQARRAVLRPPPRMNLPDWADKYRHLSPAAGAVGGPWQTHRVEVARGPMMAVTEPGVQKITAMAATQLLKTELLTNTIGYFAHLDPCPMLLLEPKDEMADAFSKERITPMIQVSPVLAEIMADPRTRNSDNTLSFKRFPGGFLAIYGAGSPTNLAMRAIRVVLLDEIDKYETTKEGDPVALAEERSSTFMSAALCIRACSPTLEETSRIYRSYLEGDQRRPYVNCPHCDHFQTLDFFKHVLWDKDEAAGEHNPESAAIYCEACGAAWTEAQRKKVVTSRHAIRHMQTRPFTCCGERQDPAVERLWDWDETLQVGYAKCKTCGEHPVSNAHASFQVSKLYSPFATIVSLVKKWLESKDEPETRQTFYNTQLGMTYRAEVTKEVASHWLLSRREKYAAEVPEGVAVITIGADVQPGGANSLGRIELETVGWGAHEESWSLGVEVINGDPSMPAVWAEVDKYLLKAWRHERGFDMFATATCIDSGGHNTQDVYAFARARTGRNVWAIKGASDQGSWSPVWPPPSKDQHKAMRVGWKPIILGVNSAKEAIRQRLMIPTPGPGYAHFPHDRSEGWFDQLTSEELRLERHHGTTIRKWYLRKNRHNEALDTRVYAYSALQGLKVVRRFNLEVQAAFMANYRPTASPSVSTAPRRKMRPSTFLDG